MAAYHQMGHDSWNLVGEAALEAFKGIVLSPVNDGPDEIVEKLAALDMPHGTPDIVLDPQFYKPRSDRGSLPKWSYFSGDFETADLSNGRWWRERCRMLVRESERIGVTSIASPAILPRAFDIDYYDWVVSCAEMLQETIEQPRVSTLITAIVRFSEIARPGAAERIASVLTRTRLSRIYLVLHDALQPRQQRTDAEALAGAMSLISMLEQAGSNVLVAFSGLDMLLWKAAGATDLATGKFFNLRRFVPGRWDEPAEGARVLAYWTDGELITWLREEDVRLLLRLELIDRGAASANPYSRAILETLDRRAGEAWLKWSWRQYLYWFGQRETEIGADPAIARSILARADDTWRALDRKSVYLFDRANDGSWVRAWLNALLLA